MTGKERTALKKSIKSTLDKADHMMDLAIIGVKLGVTENFEASVKGRKTIVLDLETLKAKLYADVEKYIAEIDEKIRDMS